MEKYNKINPDFDGGYRQGLDYALELLQSSECKCEAIKEVEEELRRCP